MQCYSTISVHELLGSSINTRESSSVIMEIIKNDPCDYTELDFAEVDYISRSFADQFHFDKLQCATEMNKNIIVSNASPSIITMLQIVAKLQVEATKRKVSEMPVYKYTSYPELKDFLLSF